MGSIRSSAGSALKGALMAAGGAVFVAALVFALLIGGVVVAFSQLHFAHPSSGRKRLHAIPIAQSACPYVKAMRAAAYDFELANPDIFGSPLNVSQHQLDRLSDPKQWPAVKAEVDRTIVVLDLSMRIASSHLPPAVRQQLAVVHQALHDGRIQLHRARSAIDLSLSAHAVDAERRGQTAFGNASDLIGTACGAPLGF